MPNLRKLKIGFNGLGADQHGTAAISIEHLLGLREISAKIGGAKADAESTLMAAISNHPSNPTINVQLVDCIFCGDESRSMGTKGKEHITREEQDETLEEDPDECYTTEGEDSGEDENKQADSRVGGGQHDKLYRITSATEDPDASMDLVPHSDNSGAGGVAGVSAVVVSPGAAVASPSKYESQKRRDWNTFGQYLRNHWPALSLARCSGAHVLEFMRYLDQFGKTKVHTPACPFFGNPAPDAPCPCPLRQAWASLDALVGRLRAAYEENGGRPESNPFDARAVRFYLREVREHQGRARGVSYVEKRKKPPHPA